MRVPWERGTLLVLLVPCLLLCQDSISGREPLSLLEGGHWHIPHLVLPVLGEPLSRFLTLGQENILV